MLRPSPNRTEPVRRRIGNLLIVAGLMAGTVAYGAVVTKGIVVDSNVAGEAAGRAIADPRVQVVLIDQTSDAIGSQLLGTDVVRSLKAFGLDPTADIRAMAGAVVAAPEFRAAFVETIRELHHEVFVHRGARPVVDATALVTVARQAAMARNPVYARLVPAAGTLRVSVPADNLPDLTGLGRGLGSRTAALALAAAVLALIGMIVHADRPRALRRIGVWCGGVALLQAAVAFALPVAASALGGIAGPIAEAVAHTLLPRLLAPAGMVAGAGIGIVLAAWRWRRFADRHHERAGAEAFLGPDAAAVAAMTFVAAPIETAQLRSPMGAPPVRRATG